MKEVMNVNHDLRRGIGRYEVGLFLVADKDEVNLPGLLQSLDAVSDSSGVAKPTFSQSPPPRGILAQVVFLNTRRSPTGDFTTLQGLLQVVEGPSNSGKRREDTASHQQHTLGEGGSAWLHTTGRDRFLLKG